MWSNPFSHDLSSNFLSVGLTHNTRYSANEWFNLMYYYNPGYYAYTDYTIHFGRQQYYYEIRPVGTYDDRFEMLGTMGTAHRTTARIIFRPKFCEDVAEALKPALQGHQCFF